jgi:hypothetical protein
VLSTRWVHGAWMRVVWSVLRRVSSIPNLKKGETIPNANEVLPRRIPR